MRATTCTVHPGIRTDRKPCYRCSKEEVMQDDTSTTTALVEPDPMPDPESPEEEAGYPVLAMTAEEQHVLELDTIVREMIGNLVEEAFGEDEPERLLHPLVTVDYPVVDVYNTIVVEIYAGGPAAPEEYDSATLIARITDFDPTDTAEVERIYKALQPAGLAYLREGTIPEWPVRIYGRHPATSGLAGPAEPRQPTLSDEVFGPYHLRVVKISVSGSFNVPLAHLADRRASSITHCRVISADREEDGEDDGEGAFGEDPGLEVAADAFLEEGDVEVPPQDETLPFGQEDEAGEAELLEAADE